MRKTGMRLLAVLLAVVMVLPSVLIPGMAAEATGFTDVPEGSWYGDAVNYVSEKGYMTGVGDNKFAPKDEVTRAMFVTILARITMAETDGTVSAFNDVPVNKWYTGAVSWAAENGIVNGVGDGMFAPGKSITRQDLCTILYRFVNAMDYELTVGEEKTFTDSASVSSYAAEAVRYASSVGLIAGYDDGTFRPKATATRAQMAVIIMRLARLLDGQIVKPEPMPAQSFNGAAGEDMTVAVNAPAGALPENTNMTVSRVSDEMSLAALKSLVNNKIYAAADISFSKGSVELEPKTEVEVQLELAGLDGIENPAVVHIRDDGTVEYINSELVSLDRAGNQKALRFHAKDFSVYAVTEGSGTGFYNVTVEFYARANGSSGDWQLINKQIVRNDQLGTGKTPVTDPGVPTIDENQSFEGWFEATTAPASFSDADADEGQSVADINDTVNGQSGVATLKYYALIYDVVYITYHDQAGNVLETESNHVTFAADGTATLAKVFEKTYIPYKGDQQFFGWTPQSNVKVENGEMVLGDYPEYVSTDESAYYEVDGNPVDPPLAFSKSNNDLHVYPFLARGYWLIFDNNISVNNDASHNNFNDSTSASYTAPVLYRAGVNTVKPANPTRTGYKFDDGTANAKWYSDPGMTRPFEFGQPLTADTTIYAKWTPAATTYRIVFWQQKRTDSVDAVDTVPEGNPENKTLKEWDYYVPTGSVTLVRPATTGQSVSLTTADKQMGNRNNSTTNYGEMGYYFDFNTVLSTTGSVKAAGDGSTVLNAYYNRKTMTINFRTAWTTVQWDDYESVGYDSSIGYYRWNLYFYVDETHRNGSGSSSQVLTLTAAENSGYPDENGRVYAGYLYSRYSNINTAYNNSALSIKTTDSKCVWKLNGSNYSGDIYGLSMSTDATATSPIWWTYQGLYKGPLTWPGGTMTSNSWAIDWVEENGKTYSLSPRDNTDVMDGKYTTTYDLYLIQETTSNPKTVHWMKEKVAGGYEEAFATVINDNYSSQGYTKNKFNGFTAYGHNPTQDKTSSSGGFVDTTSQSNPSVAYDDMGANCYIYYSRNKYHLTFDSNNATLVYNSSDESIAIPSSLPNPSSIPYEKELEAYKDFVPKNGPEGAYFDGWYADPGFSREFDFEKEEMPANDVTVYAKWTKIRFRTVLDYNAPAAEVTFPGNQADSFRLDYGETVREGAIMAAERPGYVLLGWYYTDNKGKEQDFNFHMGAHEDMADMTYIDWADADRQDDYKVPGVVNSTTGEPMTHWSDVGLENVRGYIRIYAKWRENPEGLTGVNVKYFADTDYEHYDKVQEGYFNPNQSKDVWDDPYIYTNLAEAYAQAASSPFNVKQKFLYWEIVNEAGDVVKTVYPGQTFTVQTGDAHYTHTLKDQYVVCAHKDENKESTIVAVAAVAPTCTATGLKAHYRCTLCGRLFTDAAGTERTTLEAQTEPALGHDVTGVDWSKNDSKHWHVCKRCHENVDIAAHTMGEPVITPPSGGNPGTKTETCTVCRHSVTTEFNGYTVTFSVPGGVTAPADQVVEPGNAVDLTATPTGTIEGYTFLGWVANPVTETATEVTPLSSYTPASDATLYALYSHSGNEKIYKLVTEALTNWAGNYVITGTRTTDTAELVLTGVTTTSNKSLESSTAGGATAFASTGITKDGNVLRNVPAVYVFELAQTANGFSIQNTDKNNWVGGYSTSYYLYSFANYSANYCDWTIAFQSDNNTIRAQNVYAASDSSNNFKYLAISTTAANRYFVMQGTGGIDGTGTNTAYTYFWKETYETLYTTLPEEVEEPVEAVRTVENVSEPVTEPVETRGLNPGQPVTVTNTVWEPVDTINLGEEYLIGYTTTNSVTNETKTYLMMSYNPATSAYYTSASVSGYTADQVCYAIPAILDASGNVTGVDTTNFSGATLNHAAWTFAQGSTSEKYRIQSVYDTSKYLRVDNHGSSYSTYLGLYPATYSRNYSQYWMWDSASKHLYYFNSSSYLTKYIAALTNKSSGEVTCFDADADSDYAVSLQLFHKVVSHTLTVKFAGPDDGTFQAPATFTVQIPEGTAYSYDVAELISNNNLGGNVTGYTPNATAITGTMDTEDVTVTVTYRETVVKTERWREVETIDDVTKDYLIGVEINGQIYLLVNNSTFTYDGTQYTKVGLAGFDGAILTSVSGATDDLTNCRWNFSTTNGGTITSAQNSSMGLYFTANGGLYPSATPDTWVWGGSAHTMTATVNNTWYMYGTTVNGTLVAGVKQDRSATVRIYREVEDENTDYDVVFVDEDGNAYTSIPTQTIKSGEKASEPAAPEKADYYFLGWYEEGADTPFNFNTPIEKDYKLYARYDYMYVDTYTVWLRAVYGIPNTTGKTHIYWYENDGTTVTVTETVNGEQVQLSLGEGAGDRYEQNEINLNVGVDIPTPANWTGRTDASQHLTNREDRIFLGWARVKNESGAASGSDHSWLDEDDLYLKWNGTQYQIKNNDGEWVNLPTFATTNHAYGGEVGQVYATEETPYHDMYAVWATYAYVLHSSSGKLEAIRLRYSDEDQMPENLVQLVGDNFLYGGYYKTYGGAKNILDRADSDANSMKTIKNTAMNSAFRIEFRNSTEDKNVNTGAETYDGSKTKTQSQSTNGRFWTKAQAYTEPTGENVTPEDKYNVMGNHMFPVMGTVYYLKEVPEQYLTTKYLYTYETMEGENEGVIQNFFMLTVMDDAFYKEIGFRTVEGAKNVQEATNADITPRTAIAGKFEVIQRGNHIAGHPRCDDKIVTVDPSNFGLTRGFIAVTQADALITEEAGKSFTVMPAWETLDGVEVNSHGTLKLDVTSDKKTIRNELLGSVPTPPTAP